MNFVQKQEYIIRAIFFTFAYIISTLIFPNHKVLIGTLQASFYIFYYEYIRKIQIDITGKTVVISGCDSGFGLALAKSLLSNFDSVFVICGVFSLESVGSKELTEIGENVGGTVNLTTEVAGSKVITSVSRVKLIKLNITEQESVDQFWGIVEVFLKEHKSKLWGLVNNAGISTFGDCSWVSPKTYEMMLNVNLVGHIRMTQEAIPVLKKYSDADAGVFPRIINMTSALGSFAAPSRSPYVCTKWAFEGFSECLRYEEKLIKTIIIEPGNFIAGTDLYSEESLKRQLDQHWASLSDNRKKTVTRKDLESIVDTMRGYTTGGESDTSPVHESYIDALTKRYPYERYKVMGMDWRVRAFCQNHLPEWFVDYIYVFRNCK